MGFKSKIYLEKKLKFHNKQIRNNGIMTIIAILVLVYYPATSFEGFQLNFHLEWIIAFIVMVVGVGRAITLIPKRDEIKSELEHINHKSLKKGKKEKINEFEYLCDSCSLRFSNKRECLKHEKLCGWTCDYCEKLFKKKTTAKKHEKNCKKRK